MDIKSEKIKELVYDLMTGDTDLETIPKKRVR